MSNILEKLRDPEDERTDEEIAKQLKEKWNAMFPDLNEGQNQNKKVLLANERLDRQISKK